MAETQIEQTVEIDFVQIDALINDGNCRVSILAKELGVSSQSLRSALVEHYSNRIIFKRGRTGGVYWNAISRS